MNRKVLVRKLTELQAKIDGGQRTEFGFVDVAGSIRSRSPLTPLGIGAALGAGIGEAVTGKKKRQVWVDEHGNETTPPIAHPLAGAAIGAGAVGAGLLAHQSVMDSFGGAGGVGQAYANAGRNIARSSEDALGALKKKLMAGAGRFLSSKQRLVELSSKFQTPNSKLQTTEFSMPMPAAQKRANPVRPFVAGATAGAAGAGILAYRSNTGRVMASSAKHGFKAGWRSRGLAERLRGLAKA